MLGPPDHLFSKAICSLLATDVVHFSTFVKGVVETVYRILG